MIDAHFNRKLEEQSVDSIPTPHWSILSHTMNPSIIVIPFSFVFFKVFFLSYQVSTTLSTRRPLPKDDAHLNADHTLHHDDDPGLLDAENHDPEAGTRNHQKVIQCFINQFLTLKTS